MFFYNETMVISGVVYHHWLDKFGYYLRIFWGHTDCPIKAACNAKFLLAETTLETHLSQGGRGQWPVYYTSTQS